MHWSSKSITINDHNGKNFDWAASLWSCYLPLIDCVCRLWRDVRRRAGRASASSIPSAAAAPPSANWSQSTTEQIPLTGNFITNRDSGLSGSRRAGGESGLVPWANCYLTVCKHTPILTLSPSVGAREHVPTPLGCLPVFNTWLCTFQTQVRPPYKSKPHCLQHVQRTSRWEVRWRQVKTTKPTLQPSGSSLICVKVWTHNTRLQQTGQE